MWRSRPVVVTVTSERVVLTASYPKQFEGDNLILFFVLGGVYNIFVEPLYSFTRISLNKYAQLNLDGSKSDGLGATATVTKSFEPPLSMEKAFKTAILSVMKKIPKGSTVTVMEITSDDENISSFAADEIEFYFISAETFNLVERKKLGLIRQEQELQATDEVSEESKVERGQLDGAGVIITGDIMNVENKKRLSLRALNVGTDNVIAMGRAEY
jgi:hypothetical protein